MKGIERDVGVRVKGRWVNGFMGKVVKRLNCNVQELKSIA